MSLILFKVQNSAAQPIAGALLSAESPNGAWQGLTDAEGVFRANLRAGHYDITISAAGYATRLLPADLDLPGTITIGLDPLTANLSVRGRDFVDRHGNVVKLNGVDGFMDYRLFLDGGEERAGTVHRRNARLRVQCPPRVHAGQHQAEHRDGAESTGAGLLTSMSARTWSA
jgi:hypothetical protein